MTFPRVMLSFQGNHIYVAENDDMYFYMRCWGCYDLGEL